MSSAVNRDQKDAVLVEQRDELLIITLNRPYAMNAINLDLSNGLISALKLLNESEAIAVGVLTGAGRGFCAGMDLKAFSQGDDIGPIHEFLIHGSRKPVIAAVEGIALAGGLELALSCDFIVAAKGASFGIPEVKVGLFAAGGGLYRLPARVGFSRALEMALTGDPITAENAYDFGLVVRVVEEGMALDTAIDLARRIALNAPLSIQTSRQLVRAANGRTEEEFFVFQHSLQSQVFSSEDAKEGPRAFAEKRRPSWTGT